MQLLSHVMFNTRPVTVHVQIGNPITIKELGSTEPRVIHRALLAEMKKLIKIRLKAEGGTYCEFTLTPRAGPC